MAKKLFEHIEKVIVKLWCNKCQRSFWPHLNDITNEMISPKVCRYQDCKSPTWMKIRSSK